MAYRQSLYNVKKDYVPRRQVLEILNNFAKYVPDPYWYYRLFRAIKEMPGTEEDKCGNSTQT